MGVPFSDDAGSGVLRGGGRSRFKRSVRFIPVERGESPQPCSGGSRESIRSGALWVSRSPAFVLVEILVSQYSSRRLRFDLPGRNVGVPVLSLDWKFFRQESLNFIFSPKKISEFVDE